MSGPIKILFAIHTLADEKTAVYRGYRLRQDYFSSQGWQAEIITPDRFRFFDRMGRSAPLLYPFFLAMKIFNHREKIDLIIFHSYCGWVFQMLKFWSRHRKTKTITAFHGLEPLFLNELIQEEMGAGKKLSLRFRIFYQGCMPLFVRWSVLRSDAVTCLNLEEKKYLLQHWLKDESRIHLMTNDVPASFFISRDYAAKATKLLYTGKWMVNKGTRYLVAAFETLALRDPEFQLILAGTYAEADEVRAEFSPGCRDRIEVYPRLPHEEMLHHYRRADLFIFPSLYEAFGRALIEAMASGLPAVTTGVGIAADIGKHGENCLIVPLRDAKAITESILLLAGDQKTRERLGKNGRESVRGFTEENSLKRWFDTIQIVMNHEI